MGKKNHVPEVFTLKEVAKFLRVPARKVEQLAKAGTLPSRQIGGEWRFLKTALTDWLAGRDDAHTRLMRHAGALADDENMDALLESIYASRGRPMTEDGDQP